MLYTKEDIKNIAGIDLWQDGYVYEFEEIELNKINKLSYYKKQAKHYNEKDDKISYIGFMVSRLRLGGLLPAIIVDEEYVIQDGNHRILAHIINKSKTINILKKIKL